MSLVRSRWAAIGAAVAVTLGAGGWGLVSAVNPSGASTLVTITPCRLADTRAGSDNVGSRSTPLGAGDTFVLTARGVAGKCNIPASATALSLNVTSLNATQPSFLTIWATGATQPLASSVNPTPGEPPTPNAVTTSVSASGQFSVYNLTGAVDVIIDVNGYYVNHNHDDRYYTKQQSDALRFGIDANNRIVLGPADFNASSFLPEIVGGPQSWSRDVFLTHNFGVVDCVTAPIDVPVGRTIESVRLTYLASADATISGKVIGVRSTAGDSLSAVDKQALVTEDLAATTPGVMVEATIDSLSPSATVANHSYSVSLCTGEGISISAVALQLD